MFAAADAVDTDSNCSYQKVLDHLKLTKNNELYSMTRPVKNYQRPTQVSLEVLLYAILDVVRSLINERFTLNSRKLAFC